MYEWLPEFVRSAEFCITLKDLKYAYDPFKRYKISALDPFYSFETMMTALESHPGASLGLKVGSAGVSAIDIDHCFVDGKLTEHAEDIIKTLDAYTELSPSGQGIRILFKTKTPFDIEKYYVKNSALGLEYYDALHCRATGARMVRVSGHMINPANHIEVDTRAILDKYMMRPEMNKYHTLEEEQMNETRAKVVAYLVNILPEFYDYNNRLVDYKSESEWDLVFINMINAYTDSRAEIDYAFKNSRYYQTKDHRHLAKWKKEFYIEGTYSRVGNNEPAGLMREWLDAFDTHAPSEKVNPDVLIAVLEEIGVIKVLNRSLAHKNKDISEVLAALIYCADKNINARVWREMKAHK